MSYIYALQVISVQMEQLNSSARQGITARAMAMQLVSNAGRAITAIKDLESLIPGTICRATFVLQVIIAKKAPLLQLLVRLAPTTIKQERVIKHFASCVLSVKYALVKEPQFQIKTAQPDHIAKL